MNRDSILAALQHPTRAWFVILLGLILIYRELAAPGKVLPGVFGGVAACVGVYALFRHPWHLEALAMILGGIALLIIQGFRKWFWIPLVSGAILITVGVHTLTEPHIGLFPAFAAVPLSGITVFLLRTAILARRNKVSLE
jgi:membrane-bound serine protease (ClpP class)